MHMTRFEPFWAVHASRKWDPPLIDAGKLRAFYTGKKLRHHNFPIHRVFVSPFLRCLQTASEVITALCAIDDDPQHSSSQNVQIDSSKIKVFLLGALAKLGATVVTYPLLVVKSRLQAKQVTGGDKKHHYKGTLDAIVKMIRYEGFYGCYKGMSTKIVQSVLAAAVLFMIKEELVNGARWLLAKKAIETVRTKPP